MKSKVWFGSALVVLTTICSAADAQTAAPAERRSRAERFDANGDGSISREEAAKAPRLTERFDAIDSNKDGQLSRDEIVAFRKAHGRSPRRDGVSSITLVKLNTQKSVTCTTANPAFTRVSRHFVA